MSNQIVISSGAKVRNLGGVLTATAGVVSSVGYGTANGVATLDANGKVPLSQLPASVVTYLGTWNAATNTPTLANGTGDIGDLYICNVAGTVNFGAGPITFAVGDWVIYNGSQWQKSAGSSGTVTSVAMTVPTGLSVTGSPITTSGTLALSLSSGYTIPTTSFLSGLVPYTGATQTVDLGSYDLNARGIKINGTAGTGHADFKHQSGTPTGSASSSTLYADTDGDLAWKNDHSYTTTFIGSGNTADRNYTLPNASGTLALTSDISYPVTSVFGRTGAVTAQSGDYTTTQVTEGTNLYYTDARSRGAISLTTTGTSGAATYNSTTGVLNIPNYGTALSDYVTLATTQTISGQKTFSANLYADGGVYLPTAGTSAITILLNIAGTGMTSSGANYIGFNKDNNLYFASSNKFGGVFVNNNTSVQNYFLPDATGTLALTSDIPSLSGYVQNTRTISTTAPLSGGGDLSANRTLSISQANSTTNGFLSSTDWNTFNNKQNALTNPVTGTGTTNTHAKFTGTSTIGNSMLSDDGTTLTSSGATRSNLYLRAASNSFYSQLAFTNGTNGGFGGISYNNSGQYMQFEANSSEWMRLNASGNFSIGNTNDTYKLDVTGTGRFSGDVTLGGSGNPTLNITGSAGAYTSLFYMNAAGGGGSKIFANGGTNTLYLGTNNVERLAITSTGNVGIGTSSPAFKLSVANEMNVGAQGGNDYTYIRGGSGFGSMIRNYYATGAVNNELSGNGNNLFSLVTGNVGIGIAVPTQKLDIYGNACINDQEFRWRTGTDPNHATRFDSTTNGPFMYGYYGAALGHTSAGFARRVIWTDTTNAYNYNNSTTWQTTSDIRIKQNIRPINNALDKICSLNPSHFEFKNKPNKIKTGFIAQEFEQVFPGHVTELENLGEYAEYFEEGEKIKSIDADLIPYLVKAIQEQQAQIEELKAKIN
jgi:hypothetical protein